MFLSLAEAMADHEALNDERIELLTRQWDGMALDVEVSYLHYLQELSSQAYSDPYMSPVYIKLVEMVRRILDERDD